jgi:5-methyltetrahydropteroyltriglutamate--homocysteine methyltransferase
MMVYRAEVVGSLLRPAWLKDARSAWQQGTLPAHEFKRIEDRAVDAAIAQQEAVNVDVITDGELRRGTFLGPLVDTVDGFGPTDEVIGAQRHWRTPAGPAQPGATQGFAITGKLRRRRSLAAEEFTYVRARARKPAKVTLPSPLMLSLLWSRQYSATAYPDPFALFADAVDIIRAEVREVAALGCTYVQIDAPELATLVDPATRASAYDAQGVSTERMLHEGIDMLNSVAEASGVTFALHMCRGNNAGMWMAEGGYDAISKQVFKRATRYDVFLLEYDDARSGGFEPLRDIPSDKRVVLGLVSTKTDRLEPPEELVARITEAGRCFPHDQLALSTQCGFASVMTGNPIREDTQPAKLRLVAETARRAWS